MTTLAELIIEYNNPSTSAARRTQLFYLINILIRHRSNYKMVQTSGGCGCGR